MGGAGRFRGVLEVSKAQRRGYPSDCEAQGSLCRWVAVSVLNVRPPLVSGALWGQTNFLGRVRSGAEALGLGA